MPDKSATDIVMRFVHGKPGDPPDGEEVIGECALDKDPDDRFMDGFEPATYERYSNFFEVLDFSFGFNASPDSVKKKEGKTQQQAVSKVNNTTLKEQPPDQDAKKKEKTGFDRWRSMTDEEYRKIKFGVDCDSFSFTRLIDAASPIFFKACCKSWCFKEAVLVKRVSRGAGGDNRLPAGFLRIEFKNVLIRSIKWADGDLVKETCEILFEEFKVKYKQQASSGDLLKQAPEAEWKRDTHTDPNRP